MGWLEMMASVADALQVPFDSRDVPGSVRRMCVRAEELTTLRAGVTDLLSRYAAPRESAFSMFLGSAGNGFGNGAWGGYDNATGDGCGVGHGWPGRGEGTGYGNGNGYGNGRGEGTGYGNGNGNGRGYGDRDGTGDGAGYGCGAGWGNGDSFGHGHGQGGGCVNGEGFSR